MKYVSLKSTRGFTLIELLVVIGIIGILSAVVYASFGDSRKLARDQVRKTAVKEVQLAIELYKAQNGTYPDRCPSAGAWSGSVNGTYKCSTPGADYIVGLVPDFIAALPVDPQASSYGLTSNQGYLYIVSGPNDEYKFMSNNSVELDYIESFSEEFARCPSAIGSCVAGVGAPDVRNDYAVYKGTTASGW